MLVFRVPDSAESCLLLRVWLPPYTRKLIRGLPCLMAGPIRSTASGPDAVGAASLSPCGLGLARLAAPGALPGPCMEAREQSGGPPTCCNAESDAVPLAQARRTAPHGTSRAASSGLPVVVATAGPQALRVSGLLMGTGALVPPAGFPEPVSAPSAARGTGRADARGRGWPGRSSAARAARSAPAERRFPCFYR